MTQNAAAVVVLEERLGFFAVLDEPRDEDLRCVVGAAAECTSAFRTDAGGAFDVQSDADDTAAILADEAAGDAVLENFDRGVEREGDLERGAAPGEDCLERVGLADATRKTV